MDAFDGLAWIVALWGRGCVGKLLAIALAAVFAVSAFVVMAVVVVALQGEPSVVVPRATPMPTAAIPAIPTPGVKERASRVAYDELARNTETYVGRTVYYRGKVAQALEVGSGSVLRVAVTKGDFDLWDDFLYVHYQGGRLLEKDVVDFWLRVDGRVTYEAMLGNQVTIPEMTALVAEIVVDPLAEGGVQSGVLPRPVATHPPALGSRQNPVPVGQSFVAPDGIQIQVIGVDYDAWKEIRDENQFNNPPGVGNWFVTVRVAVTNVGGSSAESKYIYDSPYGLVGDEGVLYTGYCGIYPDELTASLYLGGSTSGNICREVRGGDGNLLLTYEASFDETVYFSLPDSGQ